MQSQSQRYKSLMQRIHDGERILIDGATGTEVEIRGVPQLDNAWNGGGALTDPQILKQVHEDYIRCGAEIVISNTFGNSLHALQDAGAEDQFEFLNRRGVELAIEARKSLGKPDILVAGGITHWSWTGRHPHINQLKASATHQADIMANAGADLIILEMMVDIDRMVALIEASLSSEIPVWVGLTCKQDADGKIRLREGKLLADAIDVIREYDIPLVSIMHTEVDIIDACLEELQNYWMGPIGVYAHSGRFSGNKLVYDTTISPQDYASASIRWLGKGVQVIGGCCGVGPDHIQALAKVFNPKPERKRGAN